MCSHSDRAHLMRSMRCSRGTELYFVVYMRHHLADFFAALDR